MSVLDDAREISRNSLRTLTVTGTMVCVFCGHAACRPNCVRYALPRIVAVLEAAERLVQIITPVPDRPEPTVSNAEAALLDLEAALRAED